MQSDLNTKQFIHQVPDSIFKLNISIVELKLFLLICRFSYSGQQSTFSNAYAAQKLNVSARTIQRAVASLEAQGLIKKRSFDVYDKSKKTSKRILQTVYLPILSTNNAENACV